MHIIQRQKLLLPENFLPALEPLTIDKSRGNRREFNKIIMLASLGIALFPSISFSDEPLMLHNAQAIQAFRQLLLWLVRSVLPTAIGTAVANKISEAPEVPAFAPSNFHNTFLPPVKLQLEVEPIKTKYDKSYFAMTDGYPLMDEENPPKPIKDLNGREIRRITNIKEINYYGAVPFPCSERTELDQKSKRAYEHTAAQHYRIDPDSLKCEYVRAFNNGKSSFSGFGVAEIEHLDHKDLLLAPEGEGL